MLHYLMLRKALLMGNFPLAEGRSPTYHEYIQPSLEIKVRGVKIHNMDKVEETINDIVKNYPIALSGLKDVGKCKALKISQL